MISDKTELTELIITNDCNPKDHLILHILKKYPYQPTFRHFQSYGDIYLRRLLTSKHGVRYILIGGFHRIYNKLLQIDELHLVTNQLTIIIRMRRIAIILCMSQLLAIQTV